MDTQHWINYPPHIFGLRCYVQWIGQFAVNCRTGIARLAELMIDVSIVFLRWLSPSAVENQYHCDMSRSNNTSVVRSKWLFYAAILASFIASVSFSNPSFGDSRPSIFVSGLYLPLGIETDQGGNIFVHSDARYTTLLSKFAPNGSFQGKIELGGITVDEFVGSRLTRDPNTGNILLITPHGVIYSIDRNSGQKSVLVDLTSLAFSTYYRVFDVLLNDYRAMTIGNPNYGDAAAFRRSNTETDIFISATTGASGGFPFVMRVSVDYQKQIYSTDVVLTSQGTTAGNVNLPTGIAVNAAGTVLTAMPFPVKRQNPPYNIGGFANGLVAFSADFSNAAECPVDSGCPRWVFTYSDGQPIDFDNTGMTTDSAGNFYIASGIVGSSVCGLGAGDALVVFPADLDAKSGKCFPVSLPIGQNADIAVAPSNSNENIVYMSIYNSGSILTFHVTANVALDINGNAGQVYRLYQAAFDRQPDTAGLGYWINQMDHGTTLEQIASGFINSTEFSNLYGANPTNEQFVTNLYNNVLHRPLDQAGFDYWVNALASGGSTRNQVLAGFSESAENQANVIGIIGNGFEYTPPINQVTGTPGNDSLAGTSGNDAFDGDAGLDTVIYTTVRSSYAITKTSTGFTVSGGTDGTDTLTHIERLQFSDGNVALDIDGNAGQVYRLYQAAFDRQPDTAGLGYWINQRDHGATLEQIASGFINSAEFSNLYGANPTTEQFVTNLYNNVLHRPLDQAGFDYWVNALASGGSTRDQVLAGFSESAENQANVIGIIGNGFDYTQWLGRVGIT